MDKCEDENKILDCSTQCAIAHLGSHLCVSLSSETLQELAMCIVGYLLWLFGGILEENTRGEDDTLEIMCTHNSQCQHIACLVVLKFYSS